MSALNVEPANGRRQFEPGENIEVVAQWQLDKPPSSVEVRLVWSTQGKGDTDLDIVKVHRFENAQQSETQHCSFLIPEAPYSFSGKLVSLLWALELIAKPSDESHRCELTIAPGRQEILLHSSEQQI